MAVDDVLTVKLFAIHGPSTISTAFAASHAAVSDKNDIALAMRALVQDPKISDAHLYSLLNKSDVLAAARAINCARELVSTVHTRAHYQVAQRRQAPWLERVALAWRYSYTRHQSLYKWWGARMAVAVVKRVTQHSGLGGLIDGLCRQALGMAYYPVKWFASAATWALDIWQFRTIYSDVCELSADVDALKR